MIKPMNKNKILLIVGAVVVIVACVLLAGKYSGTSNENQEGGLVGDGSTPTSTVGTSTVVGNSTSTKPTATSSAPTVKTFKNGSFSFNYPLSWTLGGTKPVMVNNFNSKYEGGGVIPMGGAEIDVVTTTLYSGRIQDILGTELLSATNVTTSTTSVRGVSCVEAKYTGAYVAGVASQNMAAYCLRGAGLWKLYLSYRSGDAKADAHVAAFNNLLASLRFLP